MNEVYQELLNLRHERIPIRIKGCFEEAKSPGDIQSA